MFNLIGETEGFVNISLVRIEYYMNSHKLVFTFINAFNEPVNYSINKLELNENYIQDAIICALNMVQAIPEGRTVKGNELRENVIEQLKKEHYTLK